MPNETNNKLISTKLKVALIIISDSLGPVSHSKVFQKKVLYYK